MEGGLEPEKSKSDVRQESSFVEKRILRSKEKEIFLIKEAKPAITGTLLTCILLERFWPLQ